MFKSEIVNFLVGLFLVFVVAIIGLVARWLFGIYFKVKREIEQ